VRVAIAVVLAALAASCGLERRIAFDLKDQAPFCAGLKSSADGIGVSCDRYASVPSEPLSGIRMVPRVANRGAALVFHGMAEGAQNRDNFDFGLDLARQGYEVFLAEYSGYREGARYPLEALPSEARTRLDAEAALDAVEHHDDIAESAVTIVGYSLGSGVAVQLAARHPGVRALVLLAPYTTYREAAPLACEGMLWKVPGRQVLCAPLGVLVADTFDNRRRVGQLTRPVCLLYLGGDGCKDGDGLIPAAMPEELARVAKNATSIERCYVGTEKLTHQTIRRGAAELIAHRCPTQ
jgi:pimeloyl-ACP methyl ester carboxylesterase